MSFDYSMYEWRKYKQYYTEKEDGSIEFAAGTPSHVRESYARYVHQQQSMKDFATRRDLDRKKGTFDFGIGRRKKGTLPASFPFRRRSIKTSRLKKTGLI